MNRFATILAVIMLAVSFDAPMQIETANDMSAALEAEAIEMFGEVFMQNVPEARALADKIRASFPQNRLGETILPDFFGGLYINDDGILVVQTTTSDAMNRSAAEAQLFADIEGFNFILETVTFSERELRYIMDRITDFLRASTLDCEIAYSARFIYQDTPNNRVVVTLIIYNEEIITQFRNTVLDSPALYFRLNPGRPGFIHPPLIC